MAHPYDPREPSFSRDGAVFVISDAALPVGRIVISGEAAHEPTALERDLRNYVSQPKVADALRAEGAAAEREKIRLEIIAKGDEYYAGNRYAARALSDFAATLEKP